MPMIKVVIPQGVQPGGKIMAQAPNGQQIQVIIPPNKHPGEELTIEYDAPNNPPNPPPPAYPGADYAADGVPQQAVPHVEPIAQKQIHAVGVQPHMGAYPNGGGQLQQQYFVGPNGQMIQAAPGMGQPTLVYDGHGGYISAYNVQMEKRFGIKTCLICGLVFLIFPLASLFVPCCPCDETIHGTTADGREFRVDR